MIYCDVCDLILVVSGGSDLDEEGIKVICPECGYDNSYQIVKDHELEDDIDYYFLDAYDVYDDEVLLDAMAERFGTNRDDLEDMIKEKEMLGWDIRVRRT